MGYIVQKNQCKLFLFGFSLWKRIYIKPFFEKEGKCYFSQSLKHAKSKGLDHESKIYIWGKKAFPEVERYAKENAIVLYHVEDGFIRSLSLGSDLTKPYSLVFDRRGIYFDPTQESDLEYLLNTYSFDDDLCIRAKKLRMYLVEKKLSKYNTNPDKKIYLEGLKKGQKVIIVPGQVEDDASIIYGAGGMTNLELLQAVREKRPDSYIIYKPHPDVLAGNRKGNIPLDQALSLADNVITDVSLDSVLEHGDEVHTMTSLVGFESLLRGKIVFTYGMPFYAGWGLTNDVKVCKRRVKERTLDELVAATLILYPRYIDPLSNKECEVEVTLANIELMKTRYNTDIFYKTSIDIRNFISRKIQQLIKVLLSE